MHPTKQVHKENISFIPNGSFQKILAYIATKKELI